MSATGHTPRATASSNGDFILIETNSGLGMMKTDPDAPKHFLAVDVPEDEIGAAVISALSRSRQIALEETASFFDLNRSAKLYADDVSYLMNRYGYKTKRALFKSMMNMSIRLEESGAIVRFIPMKHKALESWIREKDDGIEDVVVPATSTPAEIGAAFRIALSRCR